MAALPIDAILPSLLAALDESNAAVLIAPPGAGKTTAVATQLIGQPWCEGQVILTSPRRVAARAAAERMAELIGERPGETVGYLTRLDSKQSRRTRILVVTEAILLSRLLDDPDLEGVSAILFDEAHERSLDGDLALALAIESQQVLREELRLLVMSATIDGARFGQLLGKGAPVLESEGKAHPLEVRWLGSQPELPIEAAMAQAIARAYREQAGDILAFLPGVREIERTRERLSETLASALVLPLHGQCEPSAQRRAIRRDPEGRRRIVLATSIAETSLTLDGVSVVVDSGLARKPAFDVAGGATHLVTRRASQASAAQRAGRAARQGPGTAYRLWEQGGHAGRPQFDEPEILASDLMPLALALARRGISDAGELPWLDPPPEAGLSAARERLLRLGALDGEGQLTERGRQIARLPMSPALAAMILFGAEAGQAEHAARLALLLQERGLGGRAIDLSERLDRWQSDRSPRAEASRKLAGRWARQAEELVKADSCEQIEPAIFLARALPDNIARRTDGSGESWVSSGGRGYVLDPTSPLSRAEWLVIGDAQGQARRARITAAAALSVEAVEQHLADRIERRTVLNWNDEESRAEARLQRRLGAIVLASGPDPAPDAEALAAFLLERARERLDSLLPTALIARVRHAQIPELGEARLLAEAEEWLAPLLEGRRDLDLAKGKITDALLARLDWDARQRLDRLAPPEFLSPAGTRHAIDYTDPAGPSTEIRVQALFGLDRHPSVGLHGDAGLLLKLTSPAGRPIQATRDLPGFWRGSWAEVRKEMKGRYPKHRWPEEPWNEKPSLKTKAAFDRS